MTLGGLGRPIGGIVAVGGGLARFLRAPRLFKLDFGAVRLREAIEPCRFVPGRGAGRPAADLDLRTCRPTRLLFFLAGLRRRLAFPRLRSVALALRAPERYAVLGLGVRRPATRRTNLAVAARRFGVADTRIPADAVLGCNGGAGGAVTKPGIHPLIVNVPEIGLPVGVNSRRIEN